MKKKGPGQGFGKKTIRKKRRHSGGKPIAVE